MSFYPAAILNHCSGRVGHEVGILRNCFNPHRGGINLRKRSLLPPKPRDILSHLYNYRCAADGNYKLVFNISTDSLYNIRVNLLTSLNNNNRIWGKTMSKKIIVTKPGRKPTQPQTAPSPRSVRKSFISRCIDIIIKDIKARFSDCEVIINDTPAGWEEYKRFCELARGKR